MPEPLDTWRSLSDEILSGVRDWRSAHPTATLRDIETEVDTRLARLRAQLLQDTATTSPAADWSAAPPAAQPTCPHCQTPLVPRGAHARHLRTLHDQRLTLTRQYGTCPNCGGGLFPPR